MPVKTILIDSAAVLEVHHLSVSYRGIRALEDITLGLEPGELVGLIGPNGAGKSTLIKALLGLVPLQVGQVSFEGRSIQQQRQRIAYVPQRSQIDWDYPITAWNVVMMAQTATAGWFCSPSRSARQLTKAALEQVEMLPFSQRQIGQLSGGQQQRIFLARALAQQADLFLFDEPFTGIDQKTESIMLEIFSHLKEQGKTLLVCSHEWGDALLRYDRLLLLNQRLLANGTPQAVMTFENIQRAYGDGRSTARDRLETAFFC